VLIHKYDGSTVSSAVQLASERGISARADLGNPDVLTVYVDDPNGTLDFVGYKTWTMDEDQCTAGDQRVWTGFVGRQAIARGGGDAMYPIGAGRVWQLELVELNTFLGRRVLRPEATTTDRPSETVSDRIDWLLTTVGFASGLIVDHGLIEASSVVLDAFDYRDRTGADVLRDCAVASGQNFLIRYREASNDYQLIVADFLSNESDAATFKVSNGHDATMAPIWRPTMDVSFTRSPERIASGVALPYQNGSVYEQDSGTQAVWGDIDQVAPTANVSESTTASTLATRLLGQHDTQEERITVPLRLPAANVNDVKHGQLIDAKFMHLPSWTTYRPARVLSKAISRPDNLTQAEYDVLLELAPASNICRDTLTAYLEDYQHRTTASGSGFGGPVDSGETWALAGSPYDASLYLYCDGQTLRYDSPSLPPGPTRPSHQVGQAITYSSSLGDWDAEFRFMSTNFWDPALNDECQITVDIGTTGGCEIHFIDGYGVLADPGEFLVHFAGADHVLTATANLWYTVGMQRISGNGYSRVWADGTNPPAWTDNLVDFGPLASALTVLVDGPQTNGVTTTPAGTLFLQDIRVSGLTVCP